VNDIQILLKNAIKSNLYVGYYMAAAASHPHCDSETIFELQKLIENNKTNTQILKELKTEMRIEKVF
jgi:hypothetical protein